MCELSTCALECNTSHSCSLVPRPSHPNVCRLLCLPDLKNLYNCVVYRWPLGTKELAYRACACLLLTSTCSSTRMCVFERLHVTHARLVRAFKLLVSSTVCEVSYQVGKGCVSLTPAVFEFLKHSVIACIITNRVYHAPTL